MVERNKEDNEEVPDARLWKGGRGGGGNHNRIWTWSKLLNGCFSSQAAPWKILNIIICIACIISMSNFNLHFHVFRQGVCSQGCRVTLAAFVSFFSTVHFHQIAWFRGGIVTLVTFVWLFPTVNCQMNLQIAFLRRFIITLAAFSGFFSNVF